MISSDSPCCNEMISICGIVPLGETVQIYVALGQKVTSQGNGSQALGQSSWSTHGLTFGARIRSRLIGCLWSALDTFLFSYLQEVRTT